MNKTEFATELAERCELSKADGARVLDGILESFTEAMAEHDEVALTGWGKFSAQRRKGRDATDPRDPSRTIHVPPSYVPRFKAGTILKREVRGAAPSSPAAGSRPVTNNPTTTRRAERSKASAQTEWVPLSRR